MRKEICIDNGGTLTDICVLDGAAIWTTKTLTTPFDLSQCFFDGLRKVSREIYGDEDVERLLTETSTIKYSTTQGTNALVERKGPRLGWWCPGVSSGPVWRRTPITRSCSPPGPIPRDSSAARRSCRPRSTTCRI